MDKYFDVGLYTEYWGTVQLVSRLAEYRADIVALYMEVLSQFHWCIFDFAYIVRLTNIPFLKNYLLHQPTGSAKN